MVLLIAFLEINLESMLTDTLPFLEKWELKWKKNGVKTVTEQTESDISNGIMIILSISLLKYIKI